MTHYDVLNINPSATADELHAAYKKLALQWHPDKLRPDAPARIRKEVTDRFAAITAAYSVLRDSEQRVAYDRKLQLTHKRCPNCLGAGVVYVQRSFTSRVERECKRCDRKGYVDE